MGIGGVPTCTGRCRGPQLYMFGMGLGHWVVVCGYWVGGGELEVRPRWFGAGLRRVGGCVHRECVSVIFG
jgi:hypothetical protein